MVFLYRLFFNLIFLTFSFFAIANDLIIKNANIYGHDAASDILVIDGKIKQIGNDADLWHEDYLDIKKVDLEDAFVMPGFVDQHNHVFEASSEIGGSCELAREGGLNAQIPYLRKCKQQNFSKGWLTGYGFYLNDILDEKADLTPLALLDRIFPNRPVIFLSQSSHAMMVNSQALKLAGIDKMSKDPIGGVIMRDDAGDLTGILMDNAGDMVMELAWNSQKDLFNRSYDGLLAGLAEVKKYGVTTIGDGRLYWRRGWFEVYQAALEDKMLTARISLRPWIYPELSMNAQLPTIEHMKNQVDQEYLFLDQVKLYSDGIIGNGTAKLLDDYENTYLNQYPKGLNYIAPDRMKRILKSLAEIELGAHIHSIGDGAARESLDAIENARKLGSKQNYSLTHVEMVEPSDVARFKKLNVTADFQLGSDYVLDHDNAWAKYFIGKDRCSHLLPLAQIKKAGGKISLSSDWNVHSVNPLKGIKNAIKLGDKGLADLNEAIDAYTIVTAQSLGLGDQLGSIEVGKFADFAILDQDIRTMNIDDIDNAKFLMTILGGKIVYEAVRE